MGVIADLEQLRVDPRFAEVRAFLAKGNMFTSAKDFKKLETYDRWIVKRIDAASARIAAGKDNDEGFGPILRDLFVVRRIVRVIESNAACRKMWKEVKLCDDIERAIEHAREHLYEAERFLRRRQPNVAEYDLKSAKRELS